MALGTSSVAYPYEPLYVHLDNDEQFHSSTQAHNKKTGYMMRSRFPMRGARQVYTLQEFLHRCVFKDWTSFVLPFAPCCFNSELADLLHRNYARRIKDGERCVDKLVHNPKAETALVECILGIRLGRVEIARSHNSRPEVTTGLLYSLQQVVLRTTLKQRP
jgi:hypothetical protein